MLELVPLGVKKFHATRPTGSWYKLGVFFSKFPTSTPGPELSLIWESLGPIQAKGDDALKCLIESRTF